jgi:hypothetical protein
MFIGDWQHRSIFADMCVFECDFVCLCFLFVSVCVFVCVFVCVLHLTLTVTLYRQYVCSETSIYTYNLYVAFNEFSSAGQTYV